MKTLILLSAMVLITMVLTGCPASSRLPYQKGMTLMQAGNFGGAMEQFELSLEADPTQRMPLFGKARCLYELGEYQNALAAFEQFLTDTHPERARFDSERFDAEFYRDKCKIELGIEVPQNPDNIPPERMGG